MTRPLLVGNWKMHHGGRSALPLAHACVQLAAKLRRVELVLAPPFSALAAVAAECEGSPVALAGQSLHEQPSGAFTGEISGSMLCESGCTWVLVGHSERRQFFGETNERVAAKVRAAWDAGLRPLVCVGETLQERERGETFAVLRRQLDSCLAAGPLDREFAIAYEPVWAIGTGHNASVVQVEEVHRTLRGWLAEHDRLLAARTRLVYGGSLKPDNAEALLSARDVDGGLVGGASLSIDSFAPIIEIAERVCLSKPLASPEM